MTNCSKSELEDSVQCFSTDLSWVITVGKQSISELETQTSSNPNESLFHDKLLLLLSALFHSLTPPLEDELYMFLSIEDEISAVKAIVSKTSGWEAFVSKDNSEEQARQKCTLVFVGGDPREC